MKKVALFLLLGLIITACSKNSEDTIDNIPEDPGTELYFPSVSSSEWATVSPVELGWNTAAEQPLYDLLEENDTKAFLILKYGKIAVEQYFGTFTKDSIWYWASAGKTLTAFTVGIAQEQGLLKLEDRSSLYLGEGWTSATLEKENDITIWHQLTMTSGLNDLFFDCVTPGCLLYTADAGTRWAYHNGPYTVLDGVVSAASGTTFSNFYNTELRNKIGMDGFWLSTNGLNNVYFSTPRSMARFGLLNLNEGNWNGTEILEDKQYINSMKNTSQDLNESYGYLWWLNGKNSYRIPGSQAQFPGQLIPNAPASLYAGLGKNDQKLYIVPDQGLVVVRMGNDSGEALAGPSSFDNELWGKIQDLLNN